MVAISEAVSMGTQTFSTNIVHIHYEIKISSISKDPPHRECTLSQFTCAMCNVQGVYQVQTYNIYQPHSTLLCLHLFVDRCREWVFQ